TAPSVFAERTLRQRTQIVPVNSHGTGRRIVETQDEGKNGALASSARADQRVTSPRLDLKAEILHRVLLPAAVAEGHALEVKLAPGLFQSGRVGGIEDGRFRIQHFEDINRRRDGTLHRDVTPA